MGHRRILATLCLAAWAGPASAAELTCFQSVGEASGYFFLEFAVEQSYGASVCDRRFQAWIWRHNAQRGTAFSTEQTEWLRLMKEHIASSCSISREDFDYAELAGKGGLQKAWGLFGKELDTLMNEMNEELVA